MSTEILKLVHGDIAREARLRAKPKYVEFPHAVFTVDFEIDSKLADQLDTDARFVSKMRGEVMEKYEKLVVDFAQRWAEADQVASKEPLSKYELEDLHRDVERLFVDCRKDILDIVRHHIDAWLQVRKDRTAYKREVGVNLVVGSISVGLGGFSAITGAATLGVSFVTGLIGVVKGLAKLWLEYKRLAADVDAAHAKVVQTVKDLVEAYQDSSDNAVGGKEVLKSAVADFFVVRMATIKRADTEFVTYKGKVAPLHERTADLGRALNELLDRQTQLDHKVADELRHLLQKQQRRSDKFDRFMGAMEMSRAQVQKLIGEIGTMDQVLRKHEDFTKRLAADLAELHARKPTWAARTEWVVKAASIVVSPTVTAIVTHGENLQKIADVLESSYEAFRKEVGA